MRVVLADDSLLLREGLARLLDEAGFEVVGQAATGEELLEQVDATSPDVAIVDIRMPPTHTTRVTNAGTGEARMALLEWAGLHSAVLLGTHPFGGGLQAGRRRFESRRAKGRRTEAASSCTGRRCRSFAGELGEVELGLPAESHSCEEARKGRVRPVPARVSRDAGELEEKLAVVLAQSEHGYVEPACSRDPLSGGVEPLVHRGDPSAWSHKSVVSPMARPEHGNRVCGNHAPGRLLMAHVLTVSSRERVDRRWPSAFTGMSAPHRIVGETADASEAIRLRDELRPDVILLELGGTRVDDVAACETLAAGDVPVVALAPRLDDEERADLLVAGATGYVLSTIDDDSLAIAVQAVAEVAGPVPVGMEMRDAPGMRGTSRSDFLRMTGAAAAIAYVAPRAAGAQEAPVSTNPSPSSPAALPTLPPASEGESDLLRMQRELVAAMRKPVDERRWVMVIDLRKCSGCDACTIACKAENQLPPGVVYRPVVQEEIGTYPNVRRRFLPRPCMQCEKPPCTAVCPVGATWRRQDGVVAIDYEKCIGCRYCLTACPYSARTVDKGEYYTEGTPAVQPYEEQVSPEYNAGSRRADGGSPIGNARKCHFCLHRLEAGQLPACVTSCIGHATFFGDANDPDSVVAELVGRPEARRLKEELGTQPRVYYLT